MSWDRLAHPWMLALLAVPAVVLLAWIGRRGATVLYGPASRVVAVGGSLKSALAWLPGACGLVAMACLAVALARPQDISGRETSRVEAVAIQLVIDRSGSMREQTSLDGEVTSRLEAVKSLATSFVVGDGRGLKGRAGDLIGVVAFGTYADTIAPLTQQHAAVPELIETIEIIPVRAEQGTAIGDAVALAAARLRDVEKTLDDSREQPADDAVDEGEDADPESGGTTVKSKAIVLLTDGVSRDSTIDPVAAARLAGEWGIRVYTIGIGDDRARTPFDMIIGGQGGVDEKTLKAMAEATGGRFWLARRADDLREIYGEIDRLERTEIRTDASVITEELYPPYVVVGFALLACRVGLMRVVLRRSP